jgi:hypothetical protein
MKAAYKDLVAQLTIAENMYCRSAQSHQCNNDQVLFGILPPELSSSGTPLVYDFSFVQHPLASLILGTVSPDSDLAHSP